MEYTHVYGIAPEIESSKRMTFDETLWACLKQLEIQSGNKPPASAYLDSSAWSAKRCDHVAVAIDVYIDQANTNTISIKSPFVFHPNGRVRRSNDADDKSLSPYRIHKDIALRWVIFLTTCGGLEIHQSDNQAGWEPRLVGLAG